MLNIDQTSTGEYSESRQEMLFQFCRDRHAVPVGDFSPDSVILTYDPAMWGLHFGFCYVSRIRGTHMRYYHLVKRWGFLALIFQVSSASAEVIDVAANGFTIRHQVQIAADRNRVYQAAVDDIGAWWNGDHTVSGNASNLYLDARPQGCFCERLGEEAGLVHLSVSFVNPGVMLRLTGGLGPLGLMGVAGNMTWEFESNEQGTLMTLQYAVGGYVANGLDSLAVPVDGVLVEAATRLARFVESGSPSGEAGSGADL